MPRRMDLDTFGEMSVGWRIKPVNTNFTFSTKKNNGSLIAMSGSEVIDDTQRNKTYSRIDVNESSTLQIRVDVTVSGNNAPEIELIELDTQ